MCELFLPALENEQYHRQYQRLVYAGLKHAFKISYGVFTEYNE